MKDAWRALRSAPWISIAAVLSLALGIGANTAIFSILESLLLRRLPVEEPERLAIVGFDPEGARSYWATYPAWREIERSGIFESSLAWSFDRFDLAAEPPAETSDGLFASAGFFEVLGVQPVIGRAFDSADDPAAAVLGYGFWSRRFGADPNVLGKTLLIERVPFTILGVAPPGFHGLDVGHSFDVAVPLAARPVIRGPEGRLDNPFAQWLSILGRLRPGQSLEEASLALRQAQPAIRETTLPAYRRASDRDAYLRDPFTAISAATGRSFLRNRYQKPLAVLMVVIGLVLLIACGNVAHLLLARLAGRRRELAIRSALGASRFRLVRQLLSESLVLSAIAVTLGALSGIWSSRILVAQLSTVLESVSLDVSLNGRVLGFTALLGVLTTLAFGTLPAWAATRSGMLSLRVGNEERGRVGGALLVVQVALSLVLVIASVLFLKSFATLSQLDLGFEPERVVMVDVDARRRAGGSSLFELYERAREAALAVPGVASAAASPAIPIGFRAMTTVVDLPEEAALSEPERTAHKNVVTPGWFRTFGTTLLAGRDFTPADSAGRPRVAVINQAFAARFFGDGSALGGIVREERSGAELRVVGLVEDAVYRSIREPAPPTIYLPLSREEPPEFPFFNVVARTASASAATVARSVEKAIARLDPDIGITVRPMESQVSATFNHERLLAVLSSAFGGLALLLAVVGLYGVTAHGVSLRRREIGIRMALGADSRRVVRMVLGGVAVSVLLGVVLGFAAGLWAVRFVESLLFGMRGWDPGPWLASAALLVLVSALAGFLPARRAAAVDPSVTLREL